MIKFFGVGLVAATLLVSSPISYAEPAQIDTTAQSIIQVSDKANLTDDPIITPFDTQLISPFRYTSSNAYENTFTLTPGNGLETNIWLQNLGTSKVYMKIFKNNVLQLEIPFNVGEQKTTNIYNTVSSEYRIYVYNSTGAKNDFNISARQF
ncbi:MAG TPA: hypothetical protein VGI33_07715 [Paenibacillus sp.]